MRLMARKYVLVPFVAAVLAMPLAIVAPQRLAAIELSLPGDQFWVVIASSQDVDRAIAMARIHHTVPTRVVRAANGWYAVITGPHVVRQGSGTQFLGNLVKDKELPKDIYLTKGAKFTDLVWTAPASPVIDTVEYDGEQDAILRKGDLELKLSRHAVNDNEAEPTLVATYKGKRAFDIEISDNMSEKPASRVSLVRLDPKSPQPQVVFTYFWQGAHCCTVTKIATMTADGNWHVVDGDTLDGDGYDFEDAEGTGVGYLLSYDQRFLYAFDSYAGSLAPLRIQQLVGDKIVDVTREPRFQKRLLQNLYRDEENQSADTDSWHSNGFLAGWVADSLLVGRGPEAWAKMLENYDHKSDFGPDTCTIKMAVEKCPDDKKVKRAFPAALKDFLVENGYLQDAESYKVPYQIEP